MKKFLLIFLALFATSQASASVGKPVLARTALEWQAVAQNDLDAVHAAIVSSHPGVIDPLNPGFNEWVESGYRQAQALIPQVVS